MVNVVITLVLVLLVEGLASVRLAWKKSEEPQPPAQKVAERRHTEYDALLGWVNVPGAAIDDMYGPDRDLTVDAGGFRCADREDPPTSPVRTRIVASGDSFTLGYGVDDKDTWVHLLQELKPGIDTVNMGQGGYGLDQAYLWYTRDGVALPHDIHIKAFITENYRRMTRDRFMGYGKPVVVFRDGELVVENVPPPRLQSLRSTSSAMGAFLRDLRIVQWLSVGAEARAKRALAERTEGMQETALAIFRDLDRLHREHNRVGVFVHLPVENDIRDGDSNAWRSWLRAEADRNGWIFIDLVAELRAIPATEVPALFIQSDKGRYRGARGHYTEAGNRLIAERLIDAMRATPAIRDRLTANAM